MKPDKIEKVENNSPVTINNPKPELKPTKKNLLHPMSAIVTIVVDMAFFGVDSVSLGLSVPLTMLLAFLIVFVASLNIQKNINGDSSSVAFTKAFFLGTMAGIPLPIAGTAVGFIILGMAGLNSFSKR